MTNGPPANERGGSVPLFPHPTRPVPNSRGRSQNAALPRLIKRVFGWSGVKDQARCAAELRSVLDTKTYATKPHGSLIAATSRLAHFARAPRTPPPESTARTLTISQPSCDVQRGKLRAAPPFSTRDLIAGATNSLQNTRGIPDVFYLATDRPHKQKSYAESGQVRGCARADSLQTGTVERRPRHGA